eukprot:612419-Hanusia_phi.AAC.1
MSEADDRAFRRDDDAMVVVLVHGFGGWSREEMGGKFFYWGANSDLASELMGTNSSLRLLTASVGPFSSVWDRAIELFYQIKGGRVDYGKIHAHAHKHERYGRSFPGLYPEWSESRPVHLLGHSMGGLTARALVQLLRFHGRDREEEDVFGQLDFSETISERWVKSVTTVACPHDGSPLLSVMQDFDLMDLSFQGTSFLAEAAGRKMQPDESQHFDLKLDQVSVCRPFLAATDVCAQWGLKPQQEQETWREYRERVASSKVWKEKPRDLCHHDLSLEGAGEIPLPPSLALACPFPAPCPPPHPLYLSPSSSLPPSSSLTLSSCLSTNHLLSSMTFTLPFPPANFFSPSLAPFLPHLVPDPSCLVSDIFFSGAELVGRGRERS